MNVALNHSNRRSTLFHICCDMDERETEKGRERQTETESKQELQMGN